MSLYSGNVLHSYHWEELPINDKMIARVEELAAEEDAPRSSIFTCITSCEPVSLVKTQH